MQTISRRRFLPALVAVGTAGGALLPLLVPCGSAETLKRRMTICLTCGSIGVSADQLQAIDLAQRHGFESVEPYPEYLASLSEERLHEVLASLKQHGLVFGAAGLPVDFRQDDARFQAGLKALPRLASGLQLAGAQRVGTWLAPGHATLTYRENFRQHTARLRAVAEILKDRGLRLGLEYVGTRSLRARTKFSFVRTLKETQELIAEIGSGNVGLVLDSWHWWMAADTETDILGLRPEQVVSVDLNDAPAGVSMDQQVDGRRELPLATGVIDVAGFLRALNQIGYDGPVRAEPFNKALNELNNEEACAATAAAMKKAFALL